MSDKRAIVKAAGLILAISIIGRLLGFVREQVIGASFGTSMTTDAYVMATQIMNIIYTVLGGALVAAFIPVFTSTDVHKGRQESAKVASNIANIALLIMTVISLLGIIFAPFLVSKIAPGFSAEARDLTINLTRIMLPTIILTTVVSLQRGILNSFQHFAAPAFTSAVFSGGVILAVYLLVPRWGVYGLAVGTVVATLFQILIQIPPMFGRGLKFTPKIELDNLGVRKIGELVVPVVIQMSILQAYVWIEKIFVSHLATGSLSALNFANKLMYLPFNLFVTAVNTAVFPSMSEMAAKNDHKRLGETMVFGINLIGLFTLPAAAGLFVLATPTVRLVYQHGAFDAQSTAMTAFALQFYVFGLFAQGAYNVLNRTFYSLQDTKTPVMISIIVVALNVLFSMALVRVLQHGGLALSSSLAATINMILVYWFLRKRLPEIPERRMFFNLGKILLASLAMAVGVGFLNPLLAGYINLTSTWGQLLHLFSCILFGAAVYLAMVIALRVEEAWYVVSRLKQKFLPGS